MQFFKNILKIPLFIIIMITFLVLTAAAVLGEKQRYASYERNAVKEPYFALVMKGYKDGIKPWGKAEEPGTDEESEKIRAILAQGKEGTGSSGGEGGEETETPEKEYPEGSEQGTEEAPEQEENPSSEEDPALSDNPTYIHADTMPENVNSPVMGAADYGIADGRYMSPEGTAYNTDTDGVFGQNGDYYTFRDVNDSYFSDALIVGDSRTVGLRDYGGFKESASFLCKESMSIFNLFTRPMDFTDRGVYGGSMTLLDLLTKKQYRKVYLSVGINELGTPNTLSFYQKYRDAVAVIRQLQPDALIFIQGIMHVTQSRSSSDRVFNNTSIVQRNQALATLANGHDIFYLDMNPAVCDENGDVKAELSSDGIHLKAAGYVYWHEFLVSHGIYRNENDFLGGDPIEGGVEIPGVTVPAQ